jgi:hypothetical protein
MAPIFYRSMRLAALALCLLGASGCEESNEKDLTATSGPGSAPPGAKANSEESAPAPRAAK